MAVTTARLGKLRLNAGRLAYVAPRPPHTPTPPDASKAGPLSLQWLGEGNGYEVYFGTTASPPLVGTTKSRAWVLPPLTPGTVYYWRIIAKANALGAQQSGPLWSFTATRPTAPIYLSPANHAVDQPTPVTLSWSAGVQVAGDLVFDVYFGPVPSNLPRVGIGQTATTFTTGALAPGVDYYWRVAARNGAGAVSGPTWTFETRNPTKGLITIGGVDVRTRTRIAGASIRDLLADTPNTAAFTIEGTASTVGQEVRIGLATLAGDDVLFGGYIDTVEAIYEGLPENRAWRVTAQDYVYGMNRRKVRTRYAQQSATAIALDLLSTWSAGYTGTHIAAGLPVVSGGIDFTEEDLTTCFARLAQRIGGYWYVDYAKDVHLFLTESIEAPTPITRAARVLLDEPPIHWTTDLTQIRTRVYVEGGGSESRGVVLPGATVMPVTDGSWYSPAGGLVVSGPQRISYTGKAGVGGGAAPAVAALAMAGALGAGPYRYVTTTITDGAESPLSTPSSAVTLPAVAGPTTAIVPTGVVGQVTAPSGAPAMLPVSTQVVAPGTAPAMTPVGTQVAPPSGTMSAAGALPMTGHVSSVPSLSNIRKVDIGGGTLHVPAGRDVAYYYRLTHTNARGETDAGASPTNQINAGTDQAAGFNIELTIAAAPGGQGITGVKIYRASSRDVGTGTYRLVGSQAHAAGGTFKDTQPDASIGGQPIPPTGNTTGTPGTGGLTNGAYRWAVMFVTANGETTGSAQNTYTIGSTYTAAQLSNVPTSGDGRVTARRIYRTRVNGSDLFLDGQISDNTTTSYLSQKTDASLGVAAPGINTTGTGKLVPGSSYYWQVAFVTSSGQTTPGPYAGIGLSAAQDTVDLSSVPTSGDPRVVARRIYRTKPGGGAFYVEATINDNTTTTYRSGAVSDAALGANPPTSNTTGTGKLIPGAAYAWQVTFVTSSGETLPGPWDWLTLTAAQDTVDLSQVATSPDARVTRRKIYRTAAGGGAFRLEATINDNTTTTYRSGSVADGALGVNPPTVNNTGSGGLTPGRYWWLYRFVTAAGGETDNSPGNLLDVSGGVDAAQLTGIATSPDTRVTKRRVYRTAVNGGTYKLEAEINDNTTTTYTSTKPDAQLGADFVPGNSTSAGGQVNVTGIQIGGAGTTARKVYRTTSGGAAYQLATTISDNTTTTYQDNKADSALGAGAPVAEIIQLVGIPASGPGSVRYEIRPNDPVNIFVQCDDPAAQAALAALEGGGSQGIVEHMLQDRRLALSQATATGHADLKLFSRPIITIQYATRDPKTRSGKTVHIDLPELSLVGDFTIQTVEIDEIDMTPGLYPKYRVTCSSVRFSFEDAVRRFQIEV